MQRSSIAFGRETAGQEIHVNSAAWVAGPSRICFCLLCGADTLVREMPSPKSSRSGPLRPFLSAHCTRLVYRGHSCPCTARIIETRSVLRGPVTTFDIHQQRHRERNRLWLLKNSFFVSNRQNLGDRKCLPDPRRSIVGLPDAILFWRILRERVFQQPRLFSSTCFNEEDNLHRALLLHRTSAEARLGHTRTRSGL